MTKFVHIGMPKTLTSALQQAFYASHEEIYYLGVGNGSMIDFIDDEVNVIFETLLLYAKNGYYSKNYEEAKQTIASHIHKASASQKKAIGISSEWLSFTLSADMIDNQVKAERLSQLLGNDVKIILFMRNQADLLKSLYGQYVREGLSLDYAEFINYTHDFKDRNFYYDMNYDLVYEQYARYFKAENIYFLPIEDYRNNDKSLKIENGKTALIEGLCSILGIQYPENFKLPHINPSHTDKELYHKVQLNKKYRHDFGNLIFEHANIHRSRKYFEKEHAVSIADVFKDVKMKRFLLEQTELNTSSSDLKITYEANEKVLQKLSDEFVESNYKLVNKFDVELPEEYFQLRF